MAQLAVTVIGHDRPGIISDVTARLAALGLNIEDSTMTLLGGHFAFMLLCSGGQTARQVCDGLEPVTRDGSLRVSVREVPSDHGRVSGGRAFVLSVHGADRPGIVSEVTAEVARRGGNITDLSTRLSGSLYVLVAEVDLPADVEASELSARLDEVGKNLGVDVSLRPADTDVL